VKNFLELPKEKQNLTVSGICILMSAVACLFYALPRLGIPDLSGITHGIVLKIFLFSAFIQLFPAAVKQCLQTLYPRKHFVRQSDAGWLMLIVLILSALPFLSIKPRILQAVWLPFALAALIFSIVQSLAHFRLRLSAFALWLVPLLALIAWPICRYYQFRLPFFFERLYFGFDAIDSLFHISLANMLHVQHFISNGLDGAPFSPYHFGSHWFFGQLSACLGIKPIQFYLVGFPVIILPLLFKSLLTFVIDLRHFLGQREEALPAAPKHAALFLWGPLVLGFVSVIPPGIEKGLALNYFDILLSESYTTAFAWTFLTLSLLLPLFSNNRFSGWEKFLWLACLPACLAICGLLKVSQMFLALACFSYLFFRLQRFRSAWVTASYLLTLAFCYLVYGLVNPLAAPVPYHWLDFLRVYINPGLLPLFFILFYLWTWLFILYELGSKKINNLPRLKEALGRGDLLLSEVLILLSVVGFIPGNIYAIDGMSAIFFAEVQKWIAISFLMASCVQTSRLVEAQRISSLLQTGRFLQGWPFRLAAVALMASCVIVFFQNYFLPFSKLSASIGRYRSLLGQKNIVAATAGSREMFTRLYRLSDAPGAFRRNTLLYIPKSNQLYWKMLGCQSIGFLGPSLSGMVMLNALPERSCFHKMPYYGYENYQFTPEASTVLDVPQGQLCKKARQLGFSQILELSGKNTRVLRRYHPQLHKKMIMESRGAIEARLLRCNLN
jgi:hypothetical protein